MNTTNPSNTELYIFAKNLHKNVKHLEFHPKALFAHSPQHESHGFFLKAPNNSFQFISPHDLELFTYSETIQNTPELKSHFNQIPKSVYSRIYFQEYMIFEGKVHTVFDSSCGVPLYHIYLQKEDDSVIHYVTNEDTYQELFTVIDVATLHNSTIPQDVRNFFSEA